MFGIGSTELLIIAVVALLVIGPQKLPQVMRTLGKGLAEFKRMSSDVKHTLDAEIDRAEREERKQKVKKEMFPEGEKASNAETKEPADAESVVEVEVEAPPAPDEGDGAPAADKTADASEQAKESKS